MATQGYYQQAPPQASQQGNQLPYQQTLPSLPSQSSSTAQHKQRSFSFQSHKSQKSSGSNKINLHETHEEKEAKRLHTKADPSLAMNEAEPSAIAAMKSEASHTPLRSLHHKDPFGNPIDDPDLSNPTRNRWERPLDTIRSFEAAIDGGYSRKSMHRTQTDSASTWNRRSSHVPAPQPRFPQDSYYGSRPPSVMKAESHYGGASTPGAGRSGYFDGQGYNNNGYNGRQRVSRIQSEPQYSGQNPYPIPHKDRSYETVTSAAASGSSADPTGYHTDPTSSDNSSIERRSVAKPQEPMNDYGIGFSQSQYYNHEGFAPNAAPNHPLPPPPPMHRQQYGPPTNLVRKEVPSKLQRQTSQTPSTVTTEKRKSWFSRRFSKNS